MSFKLDNTEDASTFVRVFEILYAFGCHLQPELQVEIVTDKPELYVTILKSMTESKVLPKEIINDTIDKLGGELIKQEII